MLVGLSVGETTCRRQARTALGVVTARCPLQIASCNLYSVQLIATIEFEVLLLSLFARAHSKTAIDSRNKLLCLLRPLTVVPMGIADSGSPDRQRYLGRVKSLAVPPKSQVGLQRCALWNQRLIDESAAGHDHHYFGVLCWSQVPAAIDEVLLDRMREDGDDKSFLLFMNPIQYDSIFVVAAEVCGSLRGTAEYRECSRSCRCGVVMRQALVKLLAEIGILFLMLVVLVRR
ncbi:hypothetical protein HDK90DRAFT_244581 [Phyllosticta capitalensis]|uniref:Uncharacterized protein n=1 Tax=Phyllosticta capitalensis TaxID=121624 RepID=A0ABR1YPQ0_9PEZI